MSEPAEPVGALLRRERERQGFSVQKIAEHLRLDEAAVTALEDGTYERTVPYVYARGHLRKYAELLGIAIDDGNPPPPPWTQEAAPSAAARPAARAMRVAPRVSKLPWARISIGLAIVFILLLFWWSPWKHRVAIQATTVQPLAVPAAASAIADLPASAAIAPASDAAGESAPLSTASTEKPADIEVTGRVRLHLTFSSASWVDVRDATGKRLFIGHGTSSTARSLPGKAPFLVYIGQVNGVHIEINGREVPIDPALIKGDVARFTASADGLHPIP